MRALLMMPVAARPWRQLVYEFASKRTDPHEGARHRTLCSLDRAQETVAPSKHRFMLKGMVFGKSTK